MLPVAAIALLAVAVSSPTRPPTLPRRAVALGALSLAAHRPLSAFAVKDCFRDCESNCNRVAPRSGRYCETNCNDYCAQDDRRDGLSGSISSEGAEIGLASAYDIGGKVTGVPQGVVYGADRPPALQLPRALERTIMEAVGSAPPQR